MSWVLSGMSPAILVPLAASLSAVLLLLYLLKVRRRGVEVPFSDLWRRALAEERPSRLWNTLRWLASLLLQLVLLGCLLLALADPRDESALLEGRSVVLILDTSASMSARDESGDRSRIERAVDEARAALAALGPSDEIMLVTMDGRLTPRTAFVRDVSLVEVALSDLRATATAADLREGVRFGVDALAGRPRGVIVLISDGASEGDDATREPLRVPPNIEFVVRGVGQESGNVGVTAFNVRRYPSNRTNHEVFARVQSYAATALTVRLSIRGGGALISVEEFELEPHATVQRIYTDLPTAGRQLEARVEIVGGDVVDVFPLDDVAFALLPDQRPLKVLLVTAGNLYLEGPLLLNESLEVDRLTPTDFAASPIGADDSAYDVTIFDGVAPPNTASGNVLYIAPRGEHSPWGDGPELALPILHASERSHPLMRWISGLRDVNVARAWTLTLSESDRVVASAIGGAPMIVTRETAHARLMALAFDIRESDLPLRVAYPVLLLNALDWFVRDAAGSLESARAGQVCAVPIGDRSIDRVAVISPSGRRSHASAADGMAVVYVDEVGFYRVEAGDGVVELAVNLADADESRIAPRSPTLLEGRTPAVALSDASVPLGRDPWLWLIALAFGLFFVEWVTWNRRVTV